MYKMLVLDLDGTLVSSSGKVAKADRDAVRTAEEAGVAIVLASARPFAAMSGVLRELGLSNPYVIAGSGASAWRARDSAKYFGYLMTTKQVRACARFAESEGLSFIAIREDGGYYAKAFDASTAFYGDTFGMRGYLVDFEKDDCPDCCKVMLFTPMDEGFITSCMERMQKEFPDCGVSKTWANILEFYPSKDITKENAMARLAKMLGVDLSETVAVGDDLVDIGMLRAAGLGVAMANAHPAVKAAADFVTLSNDEGGVAHVIHTRLIQREHEVQNR